ncbi:MAG TPA: hypothetical protein VGE72_17605 [Azospirillum sp.]
MDDLVIRNLDEAAPARQPLSAQEKLALVDRIRAMTLPGPQTDSVELLREDRDR